MSTGVNLMVKMSEPMKQAIESVANARGQFMSEWARDVLAKACGYDLSADEALEGRGRPRKYATDAQRKKARSDAQTRRNREQRALVDAVMRQNRLADYNALREWLEARGVSLDDEPVSEAV